MKNKPHLVKCHNFVLNLMILDSAYDIHKENGVGKIAKCSSDLLTHVRLTIPQVWISAMNIQSV